LIPQKEESSYQASERRGGSGMVPPTRAYHGDTHVAAFCGVSIRLI